MFEGLDLLVWFRGLLGGRGRCFGHLNGVERVRGLSVMWSSSFPNDFHIHGGGVVWCGVTNGVG